MPVTKKSFATGSLMFSVELACVVAVAVDEMKCDRLDSLGRMASRKDLRDDVIRA